MHTEGGSTPCLQLKSKKSAKPKTWLVELEPGSTIYYQAYELDEMKMSMRLKFPGMCDVVT